MQGFLHSPLPFFINTSNMKQVIRILFSLAFLITTSHASYAQQHDANWLGGVGWFPFTDSASCVLMRFENGGISYSTFNSNIQIHNSSVAMSDASGALQFYTNGNVVATWDHHIMEGGKGFNEGSPSSDFNDFTYGDTMGNFTYVHYTFQLIPDGYEDGVYYMLHSFVTIEDEWGLGPIFAAPKMQISKIDMKANGGRGRVVYKNRYFDEELGRASFAVVRHGNGRDWWLVRSNAEGLYYRSTLLRRDSVILTVESTMPGLNSDWFEYEDLALTAQNLLEVSPDGNMLLDSYGRGYAKLMAFDRCSGEVSLIDTFSTGIVQLEVDGGDILDCANTNFSFSPSGRYLYGAGWAELAQWDLWAADISASKVKLGGTPWAMDDFQNVLVGFPSGLGPFSLGPDGKLYNLGQASHSVIEYPDEKGEACGYCIAADNPPSCLGQSSYLYSTPHPNYRLGPLTGSGCDTILSSVSSPVLDGGYGVSASPTVASGQVEVSITLPNYSSTSTAEVQVVDMLGRVVHTHRFPPYAYLHNLDVSEWPVGLYNLVLLENGRARAGARVVVAR